jgi:hypothetical protein
MPFGRNWSMHISHLSLAIPEMTDLQLTRSHA